MKWRIAAAAVVLAGGFVAAGLLVRHGIPYHTTTQPSITIPPPPPPKKNTSLPWPTYGADNARTRAVSATGLRPPFRKVWTFYGHHLLELPPVAGYGTLYEESFDGRIHAIDPETGDVKWRYRAHRCGWASPALGQGLVFATFIGDVSSPCAQLGGGAIVALDAHSGKVRWSRNIGQTESSPLFDHGTVYFGTTDGHVYALAAATGKVRWSYLTNGAVKGSPAIEGGRLFIGTYGGSFYAFNAHTGAQLWRSDGHGRFYAGATVVGGRVYVGDLHSRVYAFSAVNGDQLWSFATGGYVYASTAVWRGIVLVGSYDNHFYAINSDGSERWDFNAGGDISGSASVIDGIVYFSTLGPHRTYALNALTGHVVEKWPDGDYSPAVAAFGRLFLVGLGRIYALEPRRAQR